MHCTPLSVIISQFFKLNFFKLGQLSANALSPASLTSHFPMSKALSRGQELANTVIESSLTASQPLALR